MWNLKHGTNEQTETDSQTQKTDLRVSREMGSSGRFGVTSCKLLYIGWINNKILLSSRENYVQYSIINHNRKIITEKMNTSNFQVLVTQSCPTLRPHGSSVHRNLQARILEWVGVSFSNIYVHN